MAHNKNKDLKKIKSFNNKVKAGLRNAGLVVLTWLATVYVASSVYAVYIVSIGTEGSTPKLMVAPLAIGTSLAVLVVFYKAIRTFK